MDTVLGNILLQNLRQEGRKCHMSAHSALCAGNSPSKNLENLALEKLFKF